jgi:hypothetical protein
VSCNIRVSTNKQFFNLVGVANDNEKCSPEPPSNNSYSPLFSVLCGEANRFPVVPFGDSIPKQQNKYAG